MNQYMFENMMKEVQSVVRKYVSIHDTETPKKERIKKELNIPFEIFWDLYGKKLWNIPATRKKRSSLSNEDRKEVIDFIPSYKKTVIKEDVWNQYQPYPLTFLNGERWKNDISGNGIDYSDIKTFHEYMKNGQNELLVEKLWKEKYVEVKKIWKESEYYGK